MSKKILLFEQDNSKKYQGILMANHRGETMVKV